MTLVEELRAEVRRLTEAVNAAADPRTKQELATRAVELSQRAEALESAITDPWVIQANIDRYRSLLASRKLDDDQTRIVKEMLSDAERLLDNSESQAP